MSKYKVTFSRSTWPLCWWGGGKIPSPLSSSLLTFHHQSECAQMQRNKEVSRRNKKMKNSSLPRNLCHALSPPWESLQGWEKLCQSPENVSLSGHCRDKSRKDLRPQDSFPQFWKAPEQKDQLGHVNMTWYHVNRYQEAPVTELLRFVRVLGVLSMLVYFWINSIFSLGQNAQNWYQRKWKRSERNLQTGVCGGRFYFLVERPRQLLFTKYLPVLNFWVLLFKRKLREPSYRNHSFIGPLLRRYWED